MNKLIVGILTHNRDNLLIETVKSFFNYNDVTNIKCILLDNGSSLRYQDINKKIAKNYGIEYIFNDYNNCENINKNIEVGHLCLLKKMLDQSGDMFCILEDDWKCFGEIPINAIDKFLNLYEDIGQVRLRDYKYDDSIYGGSSINFITMEKIIFDEQVSINSTIFKIANMHWVNACNILKRNTLEYMLIDADNEEEKMKHFFKKYPRNAQLYPGIFYPIGEQRNRKDLKEKGLFKNENIS